jgi:hypothetical protein
VQITTYTRSTLYRSKHAGFFFKPSKLEEQEHGVYVQAGNKRVFVDERMVSVRFGEFK